jgi:hypothetical protein
MQRSLLDNTQYSQETATYALLGGIRTAIPASEGPQTHSLYRAATGIGRNELYGIQYTLRSSTI